MPPTTAMTATATGTVAVPDISASNPEARGGCGGGVEGDGDAGGGGATTIGTTTAT
jgi:hypothetical protein